MKTSAATISDLFGPDKIEEARRRARTYPLTTKFDVTAEIHFANGQKRIYRSKAWGRKTALREVLTFVEAVEELYGEKVMWRLRGEKQYYLSTNFTGHLSLWQKVMKYFFDI